MIETTDRATMVPPTGQIRFKFRWLDEEGNAVGFFRKSGSFDGEMLQLDDTQIPADAILDLRIRQDKIYLWLRSASDQWVKSGFVLLGSRLNEIHYALNGIRRQQLIEEERHRLSEQGDIQEFREQACRQCQAPIILSGLPVTPQVYCEVCDSLSTTTGSESQLAFESHYRVCEECLMYSHPRKFTTFYIYFLFVIYGFWNKTTICCPACMRGEAWKMLMVNTLGFVGLPFALGQLYRAYSRRSVKGPLEGLDSANILARKGRIDQALDGYDDLLDAQPVNAGLKYNVGIGLLRKAEPEHAQRMFELSLEDCSNYGPSVYGLMNALEAQGKQEELEGLRRLWGIGIEPPETTEIQQELPETNR